MADRFADLVGSGIKTAGARRFFGWLASAENEHAHWMKEFVTDGNRDVTEPRTIRRVHQAIEAWQNSLLDLKIWKSSSVRGQRQHLLDAIARYRQIDEDAFPLIDPRLMPLGAHRDTKGHVALGELDWPEFDGVEPGRRDAVGIATLRSAALQVFERYENIFKFGQSILHDPHPPAQNSIWHDVRALIEEEIESWTKNRHSQFSKPWGESKSEVIRSLSDPTVWNDLGLDITFDKEALNFSTVADLIVGCVGPTYRLSQAIQTIFCCDTGWNRQPIQYLPVHPFAFRTDYEVFLGSKSALGSFKNRAGHAVFADPAAASVVRGLAAANYTSEWENIASELKFEKNDQQTTVNLDSELLGLMERYRSTQILSRSWTDERTSELFFYALSQRARGVQIADRDISLLMPNDSPLSRDGVKFSAVRKSFLNSFSAAGFDPSYIQEIASHRTSSILQKNYIIGAQADRTYGEAARYWQGCLQEIALTDQVAFKLQIPDKDREWFRMFGLLTGITAACGLTSIQLDGEVAEDNVFVPNTESFIELFLAHKGIKQQRDDVPVQRWEVQGKAALAVIKGIGRQISEKHLGRHYRSAAKIANQRLKSGELTLPLMLEV
ncbi:UNVERIFIED_ORG: hypothetical protein GGD47_002797 [Rhizobium etli]